MMLEIPLAENLLANSPQKVLSRPGLRREALKQNAAATMQHATCMMFEAQVRRGSASRRNAAIWSATRSHADHATRRLIKRRDQLLPGPPGSAIRTNDCENTRTSAGPTFQLLRDTSTRYAPVVANHRWPLLKSQHAIAMGLTEVMWQPLRQMKNRREFCPGKSSPGLGAIV